MGEEVGYDNKYTKEESCPAVNRERHREENREQRLINKQYSPKLAQPKVSSSILLELTTNHLKKKKAED